MTNITNMSSLSESSCCRNQVAWAMEVITRLGLERESSLVVTGKSCGMETCVAVIGLVRASARGITGKAK